MTELEKIKRAKMYMDKLANGINPLDDSCVPETELINNVRLSRCFFFVSDILRQVIENGGTNPPSARKKPKKLPFEVSFEKRSKFAFPDSPPVKSTESIGSVLFLSLLAGTRNNQRGKGRTDSIFVTVKSPGGWTLMG